MLLEKSTPYNSKESEFFHVVAKFTHNGTAERVAKMLNDVSISVGMPTLDEKYFIEQIQKISYNKLPAQEVTDIAKYILRVINNEPR